MTKPDRLAFETAKELMIAHLHNSAPMASCEDTGEDVGKMFEAIYNKLCSITSESQTE